MIAVNGRSDGSATTRLDAANPRRPVVRVRLLAAPTHLRNRLVRNAGSPNHRPRQRRARISTPW